MHLGIDLGTSAVKLLLLNDQQQLLAEASVPLTVQRPQQLWSEQDPSAWWAAVETGIGQLRRQQALQGLQSIGISGQMHGAILLDDSGNVLRPAILWNDGRSGAACAVLEQAVPALRQITGNLAMPGFTAPKLLWVQQHEPEIFHKVHKVLLPKDYLRFRLSGEYVSEMSDSAGTSWLNVAERDWSEEMLAATHLTKDHMPRLVEGSEPAGLLRKDLCEAWGMEKPPIIAGGAGDNAAGAIGIGAVKAGDAFLSLGTSGVLFVVTPQYQPNPDQGVHTFCHCLPQMWHQMGVILSASSSLRWLAQIAGKTETELTQALENAPLALPSLTFLPYLSGERTPHNNPNAQGVFFGLRHEHALPDLLKAVLTGVAFAFADCQQALQAAGAHIGDISLIGGGARSRYWGRLLATTLNQPLLLHAGAELGPALGAARLGMLAGNAGTLDEVCVRPPVKAVLSPEPELQAALQAQHQRYQRLYQALRAEF